MRLALVVLALIASGCDSKPEPHGHGEPCDSDEPCATGLACESGRCLSAHEVAELRLEEARAAKVREELARKAAAEKEQGLLRASGVEPSTAPAEAPPAATDARPGAVRVVRTSGKSPIFAACRPDERLLGGGCTPGDYADTAVRGSYPSHFGEVDSIGARWNCQGISLRHYTETLLEAYALCQKAEGSEAAPRPLGRPEAPKR